MPSSDDEIFELKEVDKAASSVGTVLPSGRNGLRTISPPDNESPRLAVEVRNANMTYGSGKKAHHALKGVNLTVPEGMIYGLLGASGCGKTTLLNVVNGYHKLDSGSVKVFGITPGSKYSSVPGRGIGFMPQDLSLYPDFTIKETLIYFGRLHQMNLKTIKVRMQFLLKFLHLPKSSSFVQNLSGGQQRRVSLAVALIHKPPLLILDEPTVGVDIVLRQMIWEHLMGLAANDGMTIIITTHYVEEARQANIIGFLRDGRILIEDNPNSIMETLKKPTLEKCFIDLCTSNSVSENSDSVQTVEPTSPGEPLLERNFGKKLVDKLIKLSPMKALRSKENGKRVHEMEIARTDNQRISRSFRSGCRESFTNVSTMAKKNFFRLKRNIPILLFQLALPSIQVVLICISVGSPPFGLNVAVVNEEEPPEYSSAYLSCINNRTVIQRPYPDLETGLQSIRTGDSMALIYFGKDFTTSVIKRMEDGLHATNQTLNNSLVRVHMDLTNIQSALILQKTFLESFQTFALHILGTLDASPLLAELPVKFEKPFVFGKTTDNYTEYVISGVNMNVAFFMAVSLTLMACIQERKCGFLIRNWVSGVTTLEILLSQMLTQSLVLCGQILFLLVFTYGVFQFPSIGPMFWVVLIYFLQGVLGMSLGLLISAFFDDESSALVIFFGAFYSLLLTSGVLWPLESQAYYLRTLTTWLPQAIPTEAIRSIMSRGWGIESQVVWSGLLVTTGWICVCVTAATFAFKIKK